MIASRGAPTAGTLTTPADIGTTRDGVTGTTAGWSAVARGRGLYTRSRLGAWRSLVARTVRVGEVPGSNPGAPIDVTPVATGFQRSRRARGTSSWYRCQPKRAIRSRLARSRVAGLDVGVAELLLHEVVHTASTQVRRRRATPSCGGRR